MRAGRTGEHEDKFLSEGKIYLTWGNLNYNLSQVKDKEELKKVLTEVYPDFKINKIRNHSGQIWAFSKLMVNGDWVALPSKKKASIHIGKITGGYQFDEVATNPFYHTRTVDWFATDIPRSNFDQDILHSLGAFLTVCQIKRNDAENRIKAMANNQWKSRPPSIDFDEEVSEDEAATSGFYDIERISRDQIAKFISQKFQGHELTALIDQILKAQGYATFQSPPGPDKGVDILAAPGSLGFGDPKLCVQVKSGDTPVDRPTLDQLVGTMRNFRAEHGLLVSWGGFKLSVMKEEASQFFQVRLWDQDAVIEELLRVYDKLDDELKAELPLKRVWAMTISED